MAPGLGFMSTQWAACKTSGDEIPARSVVYITGAEYYENEPGSSPLILTVEVPYADNLMPLGVIGPCAVAGSVSLDQEPTWHSSFGRGHVAIQGLAVVDLEAVPTNLSRPNWGTQAGSSYPLEDGIGMRTIAIDQTNLRALVELTPDLANLREETAPKYAIGLDADGCLVKIPVSSC